MEDHYDDNKLGLETYKSSSEDHHLVLPAASPLPHSKSSSLLYSQQSAEDKYHQHLAASSEAAAAAAMSQINRQYVIPSSHGHHMSTPPPHSLHQVHLSHQPHLHQSHERMVDMHYNANNPFSINRLLPGSGLSAADQSKSHLEQLHVASSGYDYNAFASHHTSESMYYPPPIYPVHHSVSSSVHSNI